LSNFLKGVNVFLVGLMGSGKTTVGRLVAEALGYRFFDTDGVIEQVAGQSVRNIFAAQGESGFRDLETQVLAELAGYTRLAIATGGGIILRQENWSYLRQGVVVWLDVPLEVLQERLQADTTRPLLQGHDLGLKLQTLQAERQSLYAQADVRVEYQPEESLEALAVRVITQIRQVIKPPLTPPDGGS
jgi:shikimate kinase